MSAPKERPNRTPGSGQLVGPVRRFRRTQSRLPLKIRGHPRCRPRHRAPVTSRERLESRRESPVVLYGTLQRAIHPRRSRRQRLLVKVFGRRQELRAHVSDCADHDAASRLAARFVGATGTQLPFRTSLDEYRAHVRRACGQAV